MDSISVPVPDRTMVLSANSHGKEVLAVMHKDPKAQSGSFVLYTYKESYTFKKPVIDKAVKIISFLSVTSIVQKCIIVAEAVLRNRGVRNRRFANKRNRCSF